MTPPSPTSAPSSDGRSTLSAIVVASAIPAGLAAVIALLTVFVGSGA